MADLFQFFLGNKSPWKMYVMAGTTRGRMPSLMSTARHVAKRPKQFMKNHSLERFLNVFLFCCKKNCVMYPKPRKAKWWTTRNHIFSSRTHVRPQCWSSFNSSVHGIPNVRRWQEIDKLCTKRFITVHQKGLFTLVSTVLDIQSSCFQSLPLGCKAGLSPFFPREVKSVPSSVGFWEGPMDCWQERCDTVSKLKPWGTRDFAHVLKIIVMIL